MQKKTLVCAVVILFSNLNSESKEKITKFTREKSRESQLYLNYMLASTGTCRHESLDNVEVLDKNKVAQDVVFKRLCRSGDHEKVADKLGIEGIETRLSKEVLLMIANTLENHSKHESSLERCLRSLTERFPTDEKVVYFSAIRLIKQKKFNDALRKIDNFLRAANLRARHGSFWALKSAIYSDSLDDIDKAVIAVDEGLSHAPRHPQLLQVKLNILLKQKNELAAIDILKKIVDVTEDPEARRMLIALHAKNNQYSDALDELLLLNDNSLEGFLTKISFLINLKRYKEAFAALKKEKAALNTFLYRKLHLELLLKSGARDVIVYRMLLPKFLGKQSVDEKLFYQILELLPSCRVQERAIRKIWDKVYDSGSINLCVKLVESALTLGFFVYAKDVSEFVLNRRPAVVNRVFWQNVLSECRRNLS